MASRSWSRSTSSRPGRLRLAGLLHHPTPVRGHPRRRRDARVPQRVGASRRPADTTRSAPHPVSAGGGPFQVVTVEVPPAGFEPALPPPEGGALSPELRGPYLKNPSAPPPPPRTGYPPPHGGGSGCPPRWVRSWVR